MRKRDYSIYPHTALWKDDDDDDIVLWDYSYHLEIDLALAKELVSNRIEYCHGKSIYALIDATNVKSSTKEARDYMNSSEGGLKGILAGAFLSNNVVTTLAVNLFLKIRPPAVPAKFFTNKEDALNWLKNVKTEKENSLLEHI